MGKIITTTIMGKLNTNMELAEAETAVEYWANATDLRPKEIINILYSGFAQKYEGNIPPKIQELLNELDATFNI